MTKELKLFSFDAETNGLWGQAFSIAAIVVVNGQEIDRFIGRCPIKGDIVEFVIDKVLPAMEELEITHNSYEELLSDFIQFWMKHKENGDDPCVALVHMGHVVETKLFRDAHELGLIGDWDAPFLWYDLCVLPEIGSSVDSYIAAHGIELPVLTGGTHNPLYDSYAALAAYEHWISAEAKKLAKLKELEESK